MLKVTTKSTILNVKSGVFLDFLPNLHGHTNLLRVFQILGRMDKLKDLGRGFEIESYN